VDDTVLCLSLPSITISRQASLSPDPDPPPTAVSYRLAWSLNMPAIFVSVLNLRSVPSLLCCVTLLPPLFFIRSSCLIPALTAVSSRVAAQRAQHLRERLYTTLNTFPFFRT
jgi:hypothetical protein